MDVKTVFLHRELEEQIYMKQPEGYKIEGADKKVKRIGGEEEEEEERGSPISLRFSVFPYCPTSYGLFNVAHLLMLGLKEVLELTRNAARDNKKSLIIPRHALLAVRNDEELGKLLASVTISSGGVFPNINFVLLPKKSEEASKSPKKD
ncbi:protein H2A.6-like [Magnolia sinica]|uniref:protein H2A.6-like n=1 Tax=Magnolia sinica TaxID=86752 RepID=UPI00265AC292|nr:protein H2A.6-like [Magnolia sinica]